MTNIKYTNLGADRLKVLHPSHRKNNFVKIAFKDK